MAFNVVGFDDAVLAFGVEIEDARARDPSYPWQFEIRAGDGAVLFGDDDVELSDRQHGVLLDLTKRHPEVIAITGDIDRDDESGRVVNVDVIRYAKGRRRTVATASLKAPDCKEQVARLIRTTLRYA